MLMDGLACRTANLGVRLICKISQSGNGLTFESALTYWCERGDLNPHGVTRQILSLVRLPIPPLSHAGCGDNTQPGLFLHSLSEFREVALRIRCNKHGASACPTKSIEWNLYAVVPAKVNLAIICRPPE
jgi:hypothetical protein